MDTYVLFICSPVDGHVGCFPLLAIVSSAAVSMCVQSLFEHSLGMYLAVECWVIMTILCLSFWVITEVFCRSWIILLS